MMILSQVQLTHITGSGGAIYLSNSWDGIGNLNININNSSFTGNNAKGDGGAIFINGSTVVAVNGDTFSNNFSGDQGGAIRITTVEQSRLIIVTSRITTLLVGQEEQ